MHVTIRHYAGNTELADTLVERQDEIKQLITEIDGFQAYYLVRAGEGATSISIYDSAAGGDESVQVARDWIAENLPDMQINPPQVIAGDAVLSF